MLEEELLEEHLEYACEIEWIVKDRRRFKN